MDIQRIHCMLEKIVECAKSELDEKGVDGVDTKEFSHVADIIKDLSESLYYRTITVAMDEAEYGEDYDWEGRKGYDHWRYASGRSAPKGKGMRRGYEMPVHHMMPDYDMEETERLRDMDKHGGKMYYTEPVRDYREGRSGMMRKSYMEKKEIHRANTPEDKQHKMKSLEDYTKELADDVTQMIEGATTEEKNLLRTKLQTLSQKIQ